MEPSKCLGKPEVPECLHIFFRQEKWRKDCAFLGTGCKKKKSTDYVDFSIVNKDTPCNGIQGRNGVPGRDWS